MALKLISFNLCPFVKKAEILLELKGVDYEVESIDLKNPPEWFMQISPLKKVPLLLVEEHVIFESSVICEYIDEAYPEQLHPDNLILRAKNRSWIEFGNACLWDSFYLTVKETEEDFNEVMNSLLIKFDQIEREVQGAYFNGSDCSLVDINFAPLFQNLNTINEVHPAILFDKRYPKILNWKKHLFELDAVKAAYSPDLKARQLEQISKRQGYLSRFLKNEKPADGAGKTIY
ncbi:MAG: glutathione S-transferase family protein [Gammaproteobacteria bacterium]|nr:glutathione S-transferase family protein [Gammaproteobacteria bacterium]